MTYSRLMVHLDLGVSNETLLQFTAGMAERFDAGVIGVTAYQPMQISYGDGYMSGDVIEQDRADIETQRSEAENRFRTVLHNRAPKLQYRSTIGTMQLADWIANEARTADLLLVAPEPKGAMFDTSRRVDIGDIVMRIGRPILVVPPSVGALDLDRVIVGWKDTRETRRAVLDALPLLRSAGQVTAVEIVEDAGELAAARAHLGDVVGWLQGHGVVADFIVEASSGDDALRLEAITAEKQAGLLVIGAYGHNRLREWVLGGMTRDTVRHPTRCSFLSH